MIQILIIALGQESVHFEEMDMLSIFLKFLSFKALLDFTFPLCVNNHVKIDQILDSSIIYIIWGFWIIVPLSNVSTAIERI